jgi:hypothetical protein
LDITYEVDDDKNLNTFPPFLLDIYDSDKGLLG